MSKNLVAIVRYAKPLEIEADPGLFENFEPCLDSRWDATRTNLSLMGVFLK